MNENKKVGLTTLNWFLSISGIIILSLFIILPPVFRTVFKEEVIIEENEPVEEKEPVQNNGIDDTNYLKVTCTKQNPLVDYNETSQIILSHENNALRILTINSNRTYLNTKESESAYTDSKLLCSSNKDVLSSISGFNYNCDITDTNINETIKYDLAVFEVNNLPTDKLNLFSPNYTLNQDITVIQNLLINDGYTCQ